MERFAVFSFKIVNLLSSFLPNNHVSNLAMRNGKKSLCWSDSEVNQRGQYSDGLKLYNMIQENIGCFGAIVILVRKEQL